MKRAMILLPEGNRDSIYGQETLAELSRLVEISDCCRLLGKMEELKPYLAETNCIITGWGMMRLEEEFLQAAPHLEAVFYGAGSVRGLVTEAWWKRGGLLTSAWAANAVPVIEYTLAALTFGLKKAFIAVQLTRAKQNFTIPKDIVGMFGAKIGVIGAGMVGGGVLERLKDYEVETFCYDPFLTPPRAKELNTTPLELGAIFEVCDAVSLHAASISSTEHLIGGRHFRSMKDGAVFINTARGRIVNETEMIEELKQGRVFAFIDVTDPEPPASDSPLYDLPNVFLTPHIAGSGGREIKRQGKFVLEEVRRYVTGEAPLYPVTQEMMDRMA